MKFLVTLKSNEFKVILNFNSSSLESFKEFVRGNSKLTTVGRSLSDSISKVRVKIGDIKLSSIEVFNEGK